MKVTNVGVIGAGTMGSGIAQVAALAGCTVVLLDREESFVHKAVDGVRARFDRLRQKGRITADEAAAAAKRLSVATSHENLADCDFVIEAVFEDLDAKRATLGRVEQVVVDRTVFATNTSSLSVADIARGLKRPERLAGMHFFNPAPLMPLVEVVAAEHSAPEVVNAVFDAAIAWGKVAVRARDVPGFIVNRVARPYYLEALRLLGDGVADVAQIDAAMTALGFRMGPFELMDLVGIDVNYAVSCSVHDRLGKPLRLEPHDIQRVMVAANTLGKKSGCGFYDYSSEKPRPVETSFADRASARLDLPPLASSADAGTACGQIQRQILFAVLNEAGHALDERVATADDIDLAMRKGTNYPRGPIAWAAALGKTTVRDGLIELNARFNGRFDAARYWC